MSWKNLASVAVIALLTSPAWAAPTLDLRNVGLNSSGNWEWELRVAPDTSLFQMSCGTCTPPNTLGGSLAVELGLRAGVGDILGVTANPSTIPNAATGSASAPVEFENPGNVIFGWETLTPLTFGNFPVGIQVGTGADSDEAFIAVGTTFFSGANPTNGYLIATIETTGPDSDNATGAMNLVSTSLEVLGSYSGSGAIAQSTSSTTSLLYTGYMGTASHEIRNGDADETTSINGLDLLIMDQNFNQSGKNWTTADFDKNGDVNGLDLLVLDQNFNQSGGSDTPLTVVGSGAGAGASAAVPEPASLVLAGLALLAGLGLVRRK